MPADTGAGRCWAIVLAGGAGLRLGHARPKAFAPLAGRPLLAWSAAALAHHARITDLLVVVPRGWGAEAERTVLAPLRKERSSGAARIHRPVIGGSRRQDSARAGLEAAALLSRGGDPTRIAVLIHDAARPIVPERVVDGLLACLSEAFERAPSVARRGAAVRAAPRGAVPVVPVGDTLKALSGPTGRVLRTVPREGLWHVQTPQAFALGSALAAHREADAAGLEFTDDAMLFEWKQWPVMTAPGSPLARKVTYAEDLALLEGWLRGPGAACRRPRTTRSAR